MTSVCMRLLIVEDNPDDAELLLRRLVRAGLDVESERVDNAPDLTRALDSSEWDAVLADYNLPGFGGLEAIRLVGERGVDIPLILVSGAIDVSTALAAVKAGARDFVFKDDTQRLPSVIEREVQEAAERRRRRAAEAERDRALAELREANTQLAAYAALADTDVRAATLGHIVESLLGRVAEAAHADGATMLFLEGNRLVSAGTVGATAALEPEVSLGDGLAGVVAAENVAHYIADVAHERPDLEVGFRGCGVRSTVGIPMHYAGRVSGVLRIDWCEPFEPPSWQMPLFELAADRCATVIENARVYEREHAIAQTLQQVLLSAPLDIPNLEVGQFYASATVDTLVGGDFYDVFQIAENRVAFSIGDVSGKGLDAARVTALIKNAIRALAVEHVSPDEVLGRSNRVVHLFVELEVFITCVYGVLDVLTGELEYASAGHPPPAVIGREGIRMLQTHGALLGPFPEASFPSATTVLAPGESLVLYTDGLTEAKSPDGEYFGEERLRTSLAALASSGAAPQKAAIDLYERVWRFSGGALRDDTAIVVLRPSLADGASQ